MAETSPEAVRRLRELIDTARRVVVFTGAGISTEFGHPRFPLAGRSCGRR